MNNKTLIILAIAGLAVWYIWNKSKTTDTITPIKKKVSSTDVTDKDIINAILGKTELTDALTPDQVNRSVEIMKDAGFTDTEVFYNIPIPKNTVESVQVVENNQTLNDMLRGTGVMIPVGY